jgi:site-specific recombinase XerD
VSRRLPEDAGALDDATYAAWCDLESSLKGKGAKPLTIDNYGWCLVQFAGWLRDNGRPAPLHAAHTDVSDYLAWLRQHGGRDGGKGSPATVDTRYRALRRFYRYWALPQIGYVDSNPMPAVPAPIVPDKPVTAIYKDDRERVFRELAKARDFDSVRDLALLRVLLAPGGPRASELCNVRCQDVDLRHSVIRIDEGKGGSPRLIPLGPAAKQAVTRYMVKRGTHRHAGSDLFWLALRGPLTRSGLQFATARRMNANPHRLRHTVTEDCKRDGMDGETARRLFGWKAKSVMWDRYGSAAADAIAVEAGLAAAARIEAR